MFYEYVEQFLLTIFSIVAAIFYLLNQIWQEGIQHKYKDNERERALQLKAKSVTLTYVKVVMISLSILFTGLPVTFGIHIKISVERLSLIIFNLLMLTAMVEYLAFRYFDKRK